MDIELATLSRAVNMLGIPEQHQLAQPNVPVLAGADMVSKDPIEYLPHIAGDTGQAVPIGLLHKPPLHFKEDGELERAQAVKQLTPHNKAVVAAVIAAVKIGPGGLAVFRREAVNLPKHLVNGLYREEQPVMCLPQGPHGCYPAFWGGLDGDIGWFG